MKRKDAPSRNAHRRLGGKQADGKGARDAHLLQGVRLRRYTVDSLCQPPRILLKPAQGAIMRTCTDIVCCIWQPVALLVEHTPTTIQLHMM